MARQKKSVNKLFDEFIEKTIKHTGYSKSAILGLVKLYSEVTLEYDEGELIRENEVVV